MVKSIIFRLAINCKIETCSIFNNLKDTVHKSKKVDFYKAFDDFKVFVSPRVLKIELIGSQKIIGVIIYH